MDAGVDEGQVLPLPLGEAFRGYCHTSLGVGGSTVYRTKRHFVEGTLGKALHGEPLPGARRKLTGQEEALLVVTACSRPPKGRARWTIELLAGEMVRLTEHDSVSRETVRRRLQLIGEVREPIPAAPARLEFHYAPRTPVGSTWSRSRSGCSNASAWTGASTAATNSSARSPPGSASAISPAHT